MTAQSAALPMLICLAGTIVAAVVDARTGFIPNSVTRMTAVSALIVAMTYGAAVQACCGAYAVGGFLLALHLLTRGRGLGLGDVKLGVAIGTGYGAPLGLVALGAAFIAGGIYAAWLLATRRARRKDAIRFGPFLAVGTLVGSCLPAQALP